MTQTLNIELSKENFMLFVFSLYCSIFLVCVAVIAKPVVDLAKQQNILNKVLISVSSMFLVMTFFAYTKPVDYFKSWYPYLYTGLIGIIVTQLVNIIFSDLQARLML